MWFENWDQRPSTAISNLQDEKRLRVSIFPLDCLQLLNLNWAPLAKVHRTKGSWKRSSRSRKCPSFQCADKQFGPAKTDRLPGLSNSSIAYKEVQEVKGFHFKIPWLSTYIDFVLSVLRGIGGQSWSGMILSVATDSVNYIPWLCSIAASNSIYRLEI